MRALFSEFLLIQKQSMRKNEQARGFNKSTIIQTVKIFV